MAVITKYYHPTSWEIIISDYLTEDNIKKRFHKPKIYFRKTATFNNLGDNAASHKAYNYGQQILDTFRKNNPKMMFSLTIFRTIDRVGVDMLHNKVISHNIIRRLVKG